MKRKSSNGNDARGTGRGSGAHGAGRGSGARKRGGAKVRERAAARDDADVLRHAAAASQSSNATDRPWINNHDSSSAAGGQRHISGFFRLRAPPISPVRLFHCPHNDSTVPMRLFDSSTPPLRPMSPPPSPTCPVPQPPSSWNCDIHKYEACASTEVSYDSQMVGVEGADDSIAAPVCFGVPAAAASSVPVCNSMLDAFNWHHQIIGDIARSDDPDGQDGGSHGHPHSAELEALVSRWNDSTWSSACSGIDAPAAAMADIQSALKRVVGARELRLPRCVHSIEWDTECLEELGLLHRAHNEHSHTPDRAGLPFQTCRFGDLASFYAPEVMEVYAQLQRRPHIAFEALYPLIMQGKGVKLTAWCYTCKKYCRLVSSDRHIAGTSCTAFSAQGLKRREFDKTILFFLSWVGLRRQLQEPQILYENVKGLHELLDKCLGDMYWVDDRAIVCPSYYGWAVTRPREYHHLRHKAFALALISPLARFTQRFQRCCAWAWREFFWLHLLCPEDTEQCSAVANELNEDIAWAQSRRSCAHAGAEPLEAPNHLASFERALSSMEVKHLHGYEEIIDLRTAAAQLNQHPGEHPMHSRGTALHCVIHNMGLIFTRAVCPPRWLSASEALGVQGFRLHPATRNSSEVAQCSFQMPRPSRVGRTVRAQAGNSMHVQAIGMVILHSYVGCSFATPASVVEPVRTGLLFNILKLSAALKQNHAVDDDAADAAVSDA